MKLRSQSLQVGPTGSQGVPGATGPAGPSGGVLVTPPVLITSAEILALHITPKVLVPAQGPGTIIHVVGMFWRFTPGLIAYTAAGVVNANWGYGPDPNGAGNLASDQIDAAITDTFERAATDVAAGNTGFTRAAWRINQDFTLAFDAPVLAGNGTLTLIIAYIVG